MTEPTRLPSRAYMSESESFRFFQHRISRQLPLHWHEFYELSYVTAGSGVNHLNGDEHHLTADTAILLSPADFHEIVPDSGDDIVLWNCIFTPDFVDEAVLDLIFSQERNHWNVRPEESKERVRNLFQDLWSEERERPGRKLAAASLIQLILIELVRMVNDAGAAPSGQRSAPGDSVSRAIRFIQHHFRKPLTLPQVAEQAHLSPAYFSERFREEVGTTFSSYVKALRIGFAKKLLRSTQVPITEVCYSSGFGDLRNFEKSFKRQVGCSPRDFRSA